MSGLESHQKRFYNRAWEGEVYAVGQEPPYAANFRSWMAKQLSNTRAALTLDVGCGSAFFTPNLLAYSTKVVGLDIADKQLERNAARVPNASFQYQDLYQRLSFDDASVDVIWCAEVLEHLLDPKAVLVEFRRILKPGGRVLITVPYHGLLKNLLIALFKWDQHFDPEYPHYQFFTIRTLSKIVRGAGLEVKRVETCGMGQPLRDAFIKTNILLSCSKPMP